MAESEYLSFLKCAVGFYNEGLSLLDPEHGDYTILAGCMVLTIGLEKLTKHVLEAVNPLMVLDKVSFDDICAVREGVRVGNRHTVSLEVAFSRLSALFPELKTEVQHLVSISKSRNFIAHQAGSFRIGKTEQAVRVNVTDITEAICQTCLGREPEDVLGGDTWAVMSEYRDAYREAEVLELDKRIAFLRRLHTQGEKLPCEPIKLPRNADLREYECPICDGLADIEVEIEADDDGGGFPYLNRLTCRNCGFAISDPDEIDMLIGEEKARELAYPDYDDY